jgi:hypothetical protein
LTAVAAKEWGITAEADYPTAIPEFASEASEAHSSTAFSIGADWQATWSLRESIESPSKAEDGKKNG